MKLSERYFQLDKPVPKMGTLRLPRGNSHENLCG